MEYNPFDYDIHRDPYPTYAWLRENAPAYHNEALDFWALSRFEDVFAALHDVATYTSTVGVGIEKQPPGDELRIMIHMDPPEHTQFRKLLARRFTPKQIADLEPRIREWTARLLDKLGDRSDFDIVHEFTAVLPITVVATMLGIPDELHEDTRRWTDDVLTRDPGSPEQPPAAIEGAQRLGGLAYDLLTRRREMSTDDLVSMLVEGEVNGEALTEQEIIGYVFLLITGGHETTSKLIANGVRLFAQHPEQRAALVANPDLMGAAVEELLRFTSPTQYMARNTTREVEIHGQVIPEGAKVALLLGSGNRDTREFERPDEFDIFRKNPRILAFGHGPHVCLGAAVARLEGRIALQEFLRRYPDYEVDESSIEFMHSGNVQGPTSVPVSVAPATAGAR